MKPRQDRTEAIDAFIDAVLREESPASEEPAAIDTETVRTIRELRAVADATPLRPEALEEIEMRILRTGVGEMVDGRGRREHQPNILGWLRGHVNSWAVRAATMAIVIALLGLGAWTSPALGYQLEHLACLVPGLGIRICDTGDLVSLHPVSVAHDGATLTVTHLLSEGGETLVGVQITGLSSTPPLSAQVHLTVRDLSGREYTGRQNIAKTSSNTNSGLPTEGGVIQEIGGPTVAGAPRTLTGEWSFGSLPSSIRTVDVEVDGPAPIGQWRVQVPLVPIHEAGLPVARGTEASATLHGVTIRVTNIASDRDRSVIQLAAQAVPPVFSVRSVASSSARFSRRLVLRDSQDRTYVEIPSQGPTQPEQGGVYIDDVVFPPLSPDARSVELVLPFVVVEERTDDATLMVPLVGRNIGDRIPLRATVALGPEQLRITGAEIVEQSGGPWLALDLQPSGWDQGRKLVGAGQVFVDGQAVNFQAGFDPLDVGQWSRIGVPLPSAVGDHVSITFRYELVGIAGPWQLVLPVSPNRSR